MIRKIGITGATGYIGRHLKRAAESEGMEVVRLIRVARAPTDRLCDINADYPNGLASGLDAIVHLALNIHESMVGNPAEIAFAGNLARDCADIGIPLIFVSSQAADTPVTKYGMTKSKLERVMLESGAAVLRPGLVYGGAEMGLWGALVNLVRRLPVLPDLGGRAKVQPLHVDDLAKGILAILKAKGGSRVWRLGADPISLSDFLREIAGVRLRRTRLFIPVPLAPLRAVLTLAEKVLGPRVSPARLDSLLSLRAMNGFQDAGLLGITLRPLSSGMSKSGGAVRSKLMFAEAAKRAVAGRRFYPWVLRRIVRANDSVSGARAVAPPDATLVLRVLESTRSSLAAMGPARGSVSAIALLMESVMLSLPTIPRLLRRILS